MQVRRTAKRRIERLTATMPFGRQARYSEGAIVQRNILVLLERELATTRESRSIDEAELAHFVEALPTTHQRT